MKWFSRTDVAAAFCTVPEQADEGQEQNPVQAGCVADPEDRAAKGDSRGVRKSG